MSKRFGNKQDCVQMDGAGDGKVQKLSGGKHIETKKENVLECLVPNLMDLGLFL